MQAGASLQTFSAVDIVVLTGAPSGVHIRQLHSALSVQHKICSLVAMPRQVKQAGASLQTFSAVDIVVLTGALPSMSLRHLHSTLAVQHRIYSP